MPLSSEMWQLLKSLSVDDAAYYCSGSIAVTGDESTGRFDEPTCKRGKATSAPVVIRWDLASGKTIHKLTLPVDKNKDGVEQISPIEDFLQHCDRATFGKNGEDVLDESYRNAVKLDKDRFATNFNPYETGMIDAISQMLLPGIAKPLVDGKTTFEDDLGVVAELYKLNVYSGPSGKFRSHVDTPRSATQFGSLVVCLPCSHEGGQLRIVHQERETMQDWSQTKSDTIFWTAFYSDCEHEVMEVTSGHRITLTYNLYARERAGGILRSKSSIDHHQYVFYNRMKDALRSPDFMPEGGFLGFYCVHAYAHTIGRYIKRLPFALKGVDAIFFFVLHRLYLLPKVRPMIDVAADDGSYRNRRHDNDGKYDGDLVGDELRALILSNEGGNEDYSLMETIESVWPSSWLKNVVWLNSSHGKPREVGLAHLAYGNEASIKWHYTAAAIVAKIPSFGSEQREQACK